LPNLAGGDSLFSGKQSLPRKGKIMVKQGFTVTVIPSPTVDGMFRLVIDSDGWEDGVRVASRTALNGDMHPVHGVGPERGFNPWLVSMMRYTTTFLAGWYSEVDRLSNSETDARSNGAPETLSQDM
jgi:hypothetical protein